MPDGDKRLSTGFGKPVDNDLNSLTAGERGPILMRDMQLMDKITHFDRERIPERVVHAERDPRPRLLITQRQRNRLDAGHALVRMKVVLPPLGGSNQHRPGRHQRHFRLKWFGQRQILPIPTSGRLELERPSCEAIA